MLYWSMIESGLALIAACLPSLNYWLRDLSSPKFLRNLRDIVTPTRRQPLQSQDALTPQHSFTDDLHGISTSSQTPSGSSHELGSVQMYALDNLESQKNLPALAKLPAGAIALQVRT